MGTNAYIPQQDRQDNLPFLGPFRFTCLRVFAEVLYLTLPGPIKLSLSHHMLYLKISFNNTLSSMPLCPKRPLPLKFSGQICVSVYHLAQLIHNHRNTFLVNILQLTLNFMDPPEGRRFSVEKH